MKPIYQKIAGGAMWMVSFKVASQLISLVSTIILARLLMPDDFGLIAMSFSLIALVDLINGLGLHITLIQKRHIDDSHYHTAWTLRLILNLVSAILLVLMAESAARFFDEPRLSYVIYALSFTFVIDGIANMGVIQFQRDMQFNKDFLFMLGPKVVGFVITIPLAFLFRTYWVLVVGAFAARFTALALSYILHDLRPRLDLSRTKEFYNMSKWLIINNILNFIILRAPALFLGKISTTRAVGLFSISHETANLPTTHLVEPINRAVFPGYAKISHDSSELADAFLDVIQTISLMMLPIGFGIAAVADVAVPLLFGSKWTEAVPLVKILAISGSIACLLLNSSSLFMSLGRPYLVTLIVGLKVAILMVAMLVLTPAYEVVGLCYAILISESASLPIGILVLWGVIGVSPIRYVAKVIRGLIGSLVMAGTVRCVYLNWFQAAGNTFELLSQLVILVILGVIVYCGTVLLLWLIVGRPDGAEKFAINWFQKQRAKYAGSRT